MVKKKNRGMDLYICGSTNNAMGFLFSIQPLEVFRRNSNDKEIFYSLLLRRLNPITVVPKW